MFVLGVSWLVLAPLCLWNLFRGGTLVRLTSALSLVALEAATIWATTSVQLPPPAPVVAAPVAAPPVAQPQAVPPPTAPQDTACPGRMPAPERVRLARHRGALRGVTLFWTARTDECDTAAVVLRHRNRTIRVWMREGGRGGATTRPVSVTGGVASLRVPLAQPVPGTGAFRAIDGRTGRPIALG